MSTTCKYCNEPENKQSQPGLICEICLCFVHLTCLKRQGTPGDLSCDVFFEFNCQECSPDKTEQFKRYKFPWVNVILLTLHHLNTHAYGISNRGFFHYKTHICSFIDQNWVVLFGPHFKQKKKWVGTIAGALSVYNNLFFRSGSMALGESGWWRLYNAFSPAVAAHIIQELARGKMRSCVRNMSMDKTHFINKVTELGYKDLLADESEWTDYAPVAKKRRSEDPSSSSGKVSSHYSMEIKEEPLDIKEEIVGYSAGSHYGEDLYNSYDYGLDSMPSCVPPSDTSSVHSLQPSGQYYDSDDQSHSPFYHQSEVHSDFEDKPQIDTKKTIEIKKKEEKLLVKRESLFSSEPNSLEMPWEVKPDKNKELVEMTQYEEVQLLKQVENLISKVKDPNKKAHLCRLKAKLALRRLKRHKHLPLFDFDKAVKLLGGYVTEGAKDDVSTERVLDRFQRSYLLDNLCGTIAQWSRGVQLVSNGDLTGFRSPYSGAILKPCIRSESNAKPIWIRLFKELFEKTHRKDPASIPPAPANLLYSYVRPQHVAAVNSLLAQFFWPGIDVSETLQYPEFSCVVTYKRLVVGCSFLVPDSGHSEAYISFVLVRPEWRGAGIATFMLYHLLQTCTGKDVTLHVSPTNPAIFLYQKFGFKVEELIQDFYEKYYDIDYKGCRHALLLRLVR